MAAWAAAGGGVGSSVASVMPAGTAPSVSVDGRNVTVSWGASTFPDGSPVNAYQVRRYDVLTGSPQPIGAACDGTVAALNCTEAAVPTGQWAYTVSPVQHAWTGAEGPPSATAAIGTASLTLSPTSLTSLPTTIGGSIATFVTGETVVFRLDDPTTGTILAGSISPDPVDGSGAASVSVTIPGGTATGAHTVYAIGSLGSLAGAAITVLDVTAPTVSAAAIAKTQGRTPGYVKQGGTYYVYASVSDPGNPLDRDRERDGQRQLRDDRPDRCRDDRGLVDGGRGHVHLPERVAHGGEPARRGLEGVHDHRSRRRRERGDPERVLRDGRQHAAEGQRRADDERPGGTVGRPRPATRSVHLQRAIEPASILAGWDGSTTTMTVRLVQNGTADQIQIRDSADSNQLPFGTLALGRTDYTTSTRRFLSSTMVMSGSTIIITLGTPNGAVTTAAGNGTMTWTPVATPYDRAANACTTTARNESGAADREF